VARRGSLFDQLERRMDVRAAPVAARSLVPARRASPDPAAPLPKLEFFNGLGGFAQDGQEYVTILGPGQATPAPWINVIANPVFGFQVAAEGTGYTWSQSSREIRRRG
jgi:cyclic beta-1,2-glucan synthetase